VASSKSLPKKMSQAGWHGRLDAGGEVSLHAERAAEFPMRRERNDFRCVERDFILTVIWILRCWRIIRTGENAAGFSLLRTGFFNERPFACERDAQFWSASCCRTSWYSACRPAAGYQSTETTDRSISSTRFRLNCSELFGKRAGFERNADIEPVRDARDCSQTAATAKGTREPTSQAPRTSRLENGRGQYFRPVHEALQYAITDPTEFDPGTQLNFHFPISGNGTSSLRFTFRQMRLGRWNVGAG